jgi:membrane dipeptidase
MKRRELLKAAAKGAAAAILVPAVARGAVATMVNRGRYRLSAASEHTYSARAIEIVQRSTVIDMCAALRLGVPGQKQLFDNPGSLKSEDYAAFKESGINVFGEGSGIVGPNAYMDVLHYISRLNGFLAHHDNWFERIDSPARLEGIKASGKVGILIGVQNSEHFRELDDVDSFYSLGQRVSQLTYNFRTRIGNGCYERRDEGLSDYGLTVVERMNSVGMAVDVSHCGDRTTLDAFDVSKKPVLITHANCRALNPNPRCKTDEAIKGMAAKGGVMGITEVRDFVSAKEPTTVESMLDHYDYVAKLAGVEHLGIGSDIDLYGYDALPEEELKKIRSLGKASEGIREKLDVDGLNYAKRPFDIAEGLIRRKYSDANIEAILGGNFRRVLREIWTV